MISLPASTFHLLRNLVIAFIVALTVTLAPIVRADTIRFVRTVFGANQATAVVRADLTH